MPDRLAQAMEALYAAGPEEFMALRKRLVAEAKADSDTVGATEIGKLRKPSVAAWAVNLVAHRAPEVVEELVDLGSQMREAQSRLDATALTGMRKERDAAVEAFVRAATATVDDAGKALSAAARQEVRATAIAALADERASEAVASGQLTRALSYSGFGEVDLAEALARTTGGAILTVVRGASPTADVAEDGEAAGGGEPGAAGDDTGPAVEELVAALAAAERALAGAEEDVAKAREHAEQTRERLSVVERQLAKAREADERALEAVTDAVRTRKQAEATRHTAQEALDRAREGG